MDTVEVFGNKMLLDNSPVSRRLRKNGVYEKKETDIVMTKLHPGDTFLDIGAHIGYYTLIASTIVGNKGNVYSIEPDPNNHRILNHNIMINKLSNVESFNVAALNVNTPVDFYLDKTNTGNHKLFYDRDNAKITVECMMMDDIFRDIPIDFVKIDTQGSEVKVLKGMKDIISMNNKLKMLIEFYPYGIRGNGDNPLEMLSILRQSFDIFYIQRGNSVCIKKVKKFKVFSNKFEGGKFCNLYCTKKGML